MSVKPPSPLAALPLSLALALLLLLLPAALAQLTPCASDDACTLPGETCNTVGSDTTFKPCENPNALVPCFCSPLNVADLVQCNTVSDCGPQQRCGTPPGLNRTNICVGCDSIPVRVTPANTGPCNLQVSESPSPKVTRTPMVSKVTVAPPPPPPSADPEPEPTDEIVIPDPTSTPTVSVTTATPEVVEPEDPTSTPLMPSMTSMPSASPTPDSGDRDVVIPPAAESPAVPEVEDEVEDKVDDEEEEDEDTAMPSMMPEPEMGATPMVMPSDAMPDMSMPAESSMMPAASMPTDGSMTEEPGEMTAEASPNPICVAVEHLRAAGLQGTDLVFAEDRRAAVLCDAAGSCATPGHMVHYAGRAMMMRSYCALTGVSCVRTVKEVNSPRFRRGLKIASRSEELSFTSFAARYESGAEERVLKTLIHLGL